MSQKPAAEQAFSFAAWPVYVCTYEEAEARFVASPPQVRAYDLMAEHNRKDRPSLYLRFAELDTNNPRTILRFLRRYGLPSYSPFKRVNHQKWAYALSAIRAEIDAMRVYLNLWRTWKYGDNNDLREALREFDLALVLKRFNWDVAATHELFPFIEPSWQSEADIDRWLARAGSNDLRMRVGAVIGHEVNFHLTNLQTELRFDGDNPEFRWSGIGFKTACYLMLALDIVAGRGIGYCGRCKLFFLRTRKNGAHKPICASWQRKRRERGQPIGHFLRKESRVVQESALATQTRTLIGTGG